MQHVGYLLHCVFSAFQERLGLKHHVIAYPVHRPSAAHGSHHPGQILRRNAEFPGTTGTPAYGTKVRLAGTDPNTGTGEIQCKGENVMLGYYKDPERTKAAFTDDGWFRTKDLACVDSKGRFSIKGRLNTVILGPSGENIYPEEIENVINGMAEVEESLVIQSDGRLVALIRPKEDFSGEIDGLKKEIMNFVNRQVSRFSHIAEVRFVKEAFEKTATHKIRRMKYCTA